MGFFLQRILDVKTSNRPAVFSKLRFAPSQPPLLICIVPGKKTAHLLTPVSVIKCDWKLSMSDKERLSQLDFELGIILYNILSKQHTFNMNLWMVFARSEDKLAVIEKKYISWRMGYHWWGLDTSMLYWEFHGSGEIPLHWLNVTDKCLQFSNNLSFFPFSFKPGELNWSRPEAH